MSIEIQSTMICDICGVKLIGPVQTTTTRMDGYWELKKMALAAHWLTVERPYKKRQHLCPKCADTGTAIPPEKQKPRKRCPKCNKVVARWAWKCKHCGESFSQCKMIGLEPDDDTEGEEWKQ